MEPTNADIIKLLISTDLHLGVFEKDPLRGADSFLVFEELLQLAVSQKVDIVLLAGDIFHENRPSRYTLWRTMEILRTYVMGPTPIRVQVVSDYDAARVLAPTLRKPEAVVLPAAASNPAGGAKSAAGERTSRAAIAEKAAVMALAARRAAAAAAAAAARAPAPVTAEARERLFGSFSRVNWEDPNYNIALPIFAIHGNHDDPSREGPGEGSILAPLDILAAASLVNYFGKAESSDSVSLVPVLLAKGITRVALYGVGNIREDRMQRMFQGDKVRFRRPAADAEDWFNLLLIHQNRDQRTLRTKTGALSIDECLPSFLDVVVWGHEHECITTTEHCGRRSDAGEEDADGGVGRATRIIQPGSTVATSLCEGEARKKHAVLLEIYGTLYRRVNVPLRCVRPFVMSELSLSSEGLDPDSADVGDRLASLLSARVEAMIKEATAPFSGSARGGAGARGGVEDGDDSDDQGDSLGRYRPPPASMRLPLIRLKVEHTGFSVVPAARFSSSFIGRVANPGELLHLYRRAKKPLGPSKAGAPIAPVIPSQMGAGGIEELVAEALAAGRAAGRGLTTVSQDALVTAVNRYAGGEAQAIKETIELAVATRKAKTGAHASITGADLFEVSTAKLRSLAKDANAAMTEAEEEENANKTPAERARDAETTAARLRAMLDREDGGEDAEAASAGLSSDAEAGKSPAKGGKAKAAAKPRAKAPAKPRAKAAPKPRGKKRGRGDDDDDGDDDTAGDGEEGDDYEEEARPAKRAAPAKKAATAKTKAAPKDDDDVIEVDEDSVPVSQPPAKKAAPKAAARLSPAKASRSAEPAAATQRGTIFRWPGTAVTVPVQSKEPAAASSRARDAFGDDSD
jgi:double-strand break repair protein MRE11